MTQNTATTYEDKDVQAAYDETLSFVIKATRGKHPLSNPEAINAAYLLQQSIAYHNGNVKPDELTAINTSDISRLTPAHLKHIDQAINDQNARQANPVLQAAYSNVLNVCDEFSKNAYNLFDGEDVMNIVTRLIEH